MIGQRRRIANAAMRWSALLLPVERKRWAEAMRAEIDAIDDDGTALDFALGCLWTSTKQSVYKLEFLVSALRIGIPAGLLSLTLLAAHLSGRHGWADTPVGTVFGILFLVFAMGAGLFLAKGATALARFAGMLIPIYLVLLVMLHSAQGLGADKPGTVLFRALAIEGIAIWSLLLLGALCLGRAHAMRHSGGRGRS